MVTYDTPKMGKKKKKSIIRVRVNMYKFAPSRPPLRAPDRNKPTQIRTPSWKTPQRRTYRRRGVQIRVGLEPAERAPRTSHSNLPRPSLLRGQFGIEIGSNQEIDVEQMSNRC